MKIILQYIGAITVVFILGYLSGCFNDNIPDTDKALLFIDKEGQTRLTDTQSDFSEPCVLARNGSFKNDQTNLRPCFDPNEQPIREVRKEWVVYTRVFAEESPWPKGAVSDASFFIKDAHALRKCTWSQTIIDPATGLGQTIWGDQRCKH